MNTAYLFPNKVKSTGWYLLVLGLILGLWYLTTFPEISFLSTTVFAAVGEEDFGDTSFLSFLENNILDELISIILIGGALLVAFSKEKLEDEFISKLRLESLIWATWVNYLVLILSIIFIYDGPFFTALVLNMVTVLLLFIAKFKLALKSSKKLIKDEE